jgi:hypothetical protein
LQIVAHHHQNPLDFNNRIALGASEITIMKKQPLERQKRIRKEWTQMQEECLQEDRKEYRRLFLNLLTE